MQNLSNKLKRMPWFSIKIKSWCWDLRMYLRSFYFLWPLHVSKISSARNKLYHWITKLVTKLVAWIIFLNPLPYYKLCFLTGCHHIYFLIGLLKDSVVLRAIPASVLWSDSWFCLGQIQLQGLEFNTGSLPPALSLQL